jgi:hypothetical protein
MVARYPLP